MSYNIRFAVKVQGTEDATLVFANPDYSNPTYNLGEMFRACMDWNYEQGEFYKVSDIFPHIKRGIMELTRNKNDYVKYNSPNGRGDTKDALDCLVSISAWITGFQEDYGEIIPLNCVYMAW